MGCASHSVALAGTHRCVHALQVLNLLLYGLRRREPDAALMAFLRVDEMLVDIGDDLTDYEVGGWMV